MSIYTLLLVVMLLAMAFNKDRLFMFTLIFYVVHAFVEAMSKSDQTLEAKIMYAILLSIFSGWAFEYISKEEKN